jgi:hypothetical protein
VLVHKLGPMQLVRICRLLSSQSRGSFSEAGAFVEAIQGRGISLASSLCMVCEDPASGRAFLAQTNAPREREAKGGDHA